MANDITIVVTAKDAATKALKSMGTAVDNLKSTVFSLQGALGGLTIGAIAGEMLNTASSFENLELSLETITGSSAKAEEAMAWITEFTATTPYELEEVANAFKKLASYGLEPTKYLKTLGDTAAAMGKTLDEAVEAFADAATGEFERLKAFGVTTKTLGDQVTFSWAQNGQQMQKTVAKTGTAITESLGQIFSERYAGGMEKLATGWSGLWSNLQDKITEFTRAVMDSGVFDYMKARLSETLELLTRMTKDGSLKELAQDIGGKLVAGLDSLWTSLKNLIALWDSLPEGTSAAVGMGILGNLLFGPAGAAVIGGGTYLIQSLTQSLEGLKRAMPGGDVSFWDYMWSDRKELEELLDQADKERVAKTEATYAQMDALDKQRTTNLEAGYKDAHAAGTTAENEYANKIKAIQNDVALFRGTEWDKIEQDIKSHLKSLLSEEEKYAAKVKSLQEKRRQAEMSTEEKIRSMLRGTMSEYEAWTDKQAEANESMAKARQALAAGNGEEAETWAKKAQEQFADLTGEVKNGEQVIISAAQAQATAVQGVSKAGEALSESIRLQEKAAESTRKSNETQANQAKVDLQSIKAIQDTLGDVEMLLTVKDGASPTLENLQLAAQKLADVKMRVSAINETSQGVAAAKAEVGEIPEAKTIDVTALDHATQTIAQVSAQLAGVPDARVNVTATDQATPVVQGAQAAVAALPKAATVNVTAKDNATGPVRWIETETGKLLTNKVMTVSAQDQATGPVRWIETETGKLLTNKVMTVSAQDNASAALQQVEASVDDVPDVKKTIVTATDQATPVVQGVTAGLGSLPPTTSTAITATDQATPVVTPVAASFAALPPTTTTTITADDQASAVIQHVADGANNLPDGHLTVTAHDNATSVLNKIQSELAQIKSKTVTVTVSYRKTGDDGRAEGGPIPGFNAGGKLPGYSLRDNLVGMIRGSMPIGLAGGEYITNARSTRLISQMIPGLLESLNRVRTGADLSRVLASLQSIPGRATGGPVESYRFTFASGAQESTVTTTSRSEADGLKALAKAMTRQKLLAGV